jgi:hypothetical protein
MPRRDWGHIDKAHPLASRAAATLGMAGRRMDRARCVDEIFVAVGKVEVMSAGQRTAVSKEGLWKQQVDFRKPSAFETCRRGAWPGELSIQICSNALFVLRW